MGGGNPEGVVKEFEFDLTEMWFMHNLETVLENETHKLLCDFVIQTDHRISANQQKKKEKKRKRKIVNFAVLAVKIEKRKER